MARGDGSGGWLEWFGLRAVPDVRKARWLGALVSVLLFLFVAGLGLGGIAVLLRFLGLVLGSAHYTDTSSVRDFGFVLAFVVGAPFLVWRALVAQKQADTAEQSHITDQINKAVEALGAEKTVSRIGRVVTLSTTAARTDGSKQLSGDVSVGGVRFSEPSETRIEWKGSPLDLGEGEKIEKVAAWTAFPETVRNTEVRIGGIYALDRIAQDSVERDHVPIMEILTTFVRENAPIADLVPIHYDAAAFRYAYTSEEWPSYTEARVRRADSIRMNAPSLSPDTLIETAVQVIARRNEQQRLQEKNDQRYGNDGYRLDLRNTNLRAVDLSDLDLSRAILTASHIECAILNRTSFASADLSSTQLERARFRDANLGNANLTDAHMEVSRLFETTLAGANLTRTHMEYAVLEGADLTEATLQGPYLERAYLSKVCLRNAKLRNPRWDEETSFKPSSLKGASLKNLDLSKVQTDEADLPQLLAGAFGDASVVLPYGLTPGEGLLAFWPNKNLKILEFEREWKEWLADREGYVPPQNRTIGD